MSDANNAIRVILVKTSHPGNIGAVARAMKTMGLTELYLVAPKYFPHGEATALATHAQDILAAATVVSSIDDALHDVSLIYATSANTRATNLPISTAREAAIEIHQQQASHKIALLFGPENYGLTNEELLFAHHLIQIPTAENYHSLNLAAAVQIIAYELRMAFANNMVEPAEEIDFANGEVLLGFFQQLEKVLIDIEFLDPKLPRQLMPRLRQLFNRAHLDKTEVNILRGMLRAVEGSLKIRG